MFFAAEGDPARYQANLDRIMQNCSRFLDFDKIDVITASVTQVRQPIYKRSVARWQRYETMLAPLLAKLGLAC